MSDDDLLAPFFDDDVVYRRAALYEAPEWYDVDYANYAAEAPFYRMLVAQHVGLGRAYVEVGAGTGRIALAIAKDGARVHAVEPQAEMLEALHAHAEGLDERSGRLTTERASLETFAGPDEPAGVIAFPFNAVLHIWSFDEMVRSFRHAKERLAPGGLFALDLTGPSWQAISVGGLPWGRVDDRVHPEHGTPIVTCDRTEYRPGDRALVSVYRFLEEGEEVGWEITLEQRMWTWQEVLWALSKAGCRVEMTFGDVDFRPFSEGSPRLLVAATAG